MRMRTTVILAVLVSVALGAAPAQAELVYVKHPAALEPAVYAANDDGTDPRRLGIGRAPTISPDGRWVAFVTNPAGGAEKEAVVLQRLEAGSQRLVIRAAAIDSLPFSPYSTKLGAITAGKRVRVYDLTDGRLHLAAEGHIRGYSFSPDSKLIVVGKATGRKLQAPSDLYVGPALGGRKLGRLTDIARAVNPVWGPSEIVFDRFHRRK